MARVPTENEVLGTIRNATQLLSSYAADMVAQAAASKRELEERLAQDLLAIATLKQDRLHILQEQCDQACRRAMNQVQQILTELGPAAAEWGDPYWSRYTPPASPPRALRFGTLRLAGKRFGDFDGPALLPFGRNVVIEASSTARSAVIQLVQALTLRCLLVVPPGRLRLLMIDPLGLGDNLAMFASLSDHMPELMTGRIWVEGSDIDRQLANLTGHIETVIQSYLRGRYASMDEYNREAGEVAEPFRLLVVMDFPANFSEEATRRLLSIATSGPRCGVLCLIVVNKDQRLPRDFSLTDLERGSEVLTVDVGRLAWSGVEAKKVSLSLDRPPSIDELERLVHAVGEAATRASTVQVPFKKLEGHVSGWWLGDTAAGLCVPIGLAGPRKIQNFEVGQGVTHHALLAGRTGSGKSTLLHVLISSLAVRYPPEELELYLVDFKKGVEFKDYAERKLPHARAIAIESEREFGLSVLQELDAKLAERGSRFRLVGCSNLGDFRSKTNLSMPRILLVLDEFQEFFSEDDQIAREATLLLDRLARQGRAFGIHLVLGSQTLAGAHSLARTTIDQMAVRIALQCSEADARLIFADDNPAARLLSRPGEAFYNSASGLKEGNARFQIAWLSEEERRDQLNRLRSLADSRGSAAAPAVVFEGNEPAQLRVDMLLKAPERSAHDAKIWALLGDPVAIKPPVETEFSLAAGRNMVIVGRDETTAVGLVGAILVSVAAQRNPESLRFYLGAYCDATRQESLNAISTSLPHFSLVSLQGIADSLTALASLVGKRITAPEGTDPRIFLVLLGLQRCRTLRRGDEFELGSAARSREPEPVDRLMYILREGPEVGVHVVIWSDSMDALRAVVDRRSMGYLGIRVATTLTERASQELIDGPAAARIGPSRAVLADDEHVGRIERFRPYGPASAELLREICEQLKFRFAK